MAAARVAAGAAASRYGPPMCPICGRTFDSRFEADEHVRSTHTEFYVMRKRLDRRTKWLLIAIFVVIGLALAPSQFTSFLQGNVWGFPAFIGLLVLTVPFVFGPLIVGTRRHRQDWDTEHPGDAQIVASSTEARTMQKVYKDAGRKYALRVIVPFLLGFIPLIFIDAALGISGTLGRATLLVYFLLYLVVQYLLLRHSSWAGRKSRGQLEHAIPIGLAREEKMSETFEKPSGAAEADFEFCPHCGSAVSRKLGGKCPKCGDAL